MSDVLVVWMDGVLCGHVTQLEGGALAFEYDETYRRTPGATPLSLSMPLSRPGTHANRVVRPFLAGLLPDNTSALNALAERFDVSPRSPFALLRHTGGDVAGALQLLPEGLSSTDADATAGLQPIGDDELEQQLLAVASEYRTGTPAPELAQRISLAGAQPKLALHRRDSQWFRPTGSMPTTHILKPLARSGYGDLDLVEHLTTRAAAALGLTAVETELVEVGSTRVFVTKRYDRTPDDGRWRRIHQEDLCQALSVPPEKKYQHRDGGPGVARIASLLHAAPDRADRSRNALSFFEGLLFNTFVQATDAHAKNYSLLLLGDRVVLAPLYDLITYAPYVGDRSVHAAMQIGGEYAYSRIGRAECLQAARALRIEPDDADELIDRMQTNLMPAFEAARDELPTEELRELAAPILSSVARLSGPLHPRP